MLSFEQSVRIAAVQFRGSSDRDYNMHQARRLIKKAAKKGAELVCLHEMLNTDYFCPDNNPFYAYKTETIPGFSTNYLSLLAKELGIYIVAGLAEQATSEDVFYNSAVAINAEGELIAHYHKLYMGSGELRCFANGQLTTPIFTGPKGLRCGILVCYDRHFPEVSKRLVKAGAELLLVPTTTAVESWTQPVWQNELQAIATLNRVYVAAANRVGPDKHSNVSLNYFGQSAIVAPDGTVCAIASDLHEEAIYADVSRREVQTWREREPDIDHDELRHLSRIRPNTAIDIAEDPLWDEVEIAISDGGSTVMIHGQHLALGGLRPDEFVKVLSGVKLACLSQQQARHIEYWRTVALHNVELIIVDYEQIPIDEQAIAELRFMAISSPCYVLGISTERIIWIKPLGHLEVGADGDHVSRHILVGKLSREELQYVRRRIEVVSNRRQDVLDHLFT